MGLSFTLETTMITIRKSSRLGLFGSNVLCRGLRVLMGSYYMHSELHIDSYTWITNLMSIQKDHKETLSPAALSFKCCTKSAHPRKSLNLSKACQHNIWTAFNMMFVCVSEIGTERFLKRGDWGHGLSLSWFGRADSDGTQCSHSSWEDCTTRRGGGCLDKY